MTLLWTVVIYSTRLYRGGAVRITAESGPPRGNSVVFVTYKNSPLRANVYFPVTSPSLHSNGEITGTENCDSQEITSLLLRSSRLVGSSRFTHFNGLGLRIISDFSPVVRTMTGLPGYREGSFWPKIMRTTRGSEIA